MERRARHVWDDQDGHLGIEFEGPAVQGSLEWPDTLEMEHRMWAHQGPAHLNRGAIVVLDDDLLSASILSRYLTVLGRDSLVATTPLEAIDMIERMTSRVEAIFIAPRLSGCSGGDLANFIASTYPGVKRVLLNRREAGPDLLQGAHKVLARPWSLASVKDTLNSLDDGLDNDLGRLIVRPELLRASVGPS
jgi:CheY-like chemotaxis protein